MRVDTPVPQLQEQVDQRVLISGQDPGAVCPGVGLRVIGVSVGQTHRGAGVDCLIGVHRGVGVGAGVKAGPGRIGCGGRVRGRHV